MLALVAGRGRLPALVADAAEAAGRPFLVFEPEEGISGAGRPAERFRLERLGGFLGDLKERGVTEVCFAGAVDRPSFDPSMMDEATARLAPRIAAALERGDDGALREAAAIFEEAGFAVRGAHELAPDLLPAPGVLAGGAVDPGDAERGFEVLSGLSALDVGQSCVVAARRVLALEAFPGTDWMLSSLRNRAGHWPEGGLLVKSAKTGQDRRMDLPAIGPDTVDRAAEAGLAGIVLRDVMLIDREEILPRAGARGVSIEVRA